MSKYYQRLFLFLGFFVFLFSLILLIDSRSASSVLAANDLTPSLQVPIEGVVFTPVSDLVCEKDKDGNRTSCEMPWLGQYIGGIYKYLIGAVGILAVVVMMFGGAMWIVSFGNSSYVGEAKAWIVASVSGLVLALGSFSVLYVVNPDLLIFKPLNLAVIKKEEIEIQYTSGGGSAVKNPSGNNVAKFDNLLNSVASKNGIDCTLLKAHMMVESEGDPNAKSETGARGLMQLTSVALEDIGKLHLRDKMYDPVENVQAGAEFLKKISPRPCPRGSSKTQCRNCRSLSCGGIENAIYVIAAYNGGYGVNQQSKICPGKTKWECAQTTKSNNEKALEASKYVPKVVGWYKRLVEKGWGC